MQGFLEKKTFTESLGVESHWQIIHVAHASIPEDKRELESPMI
jgi:hypothetical protein